MSTFLWDNTAILKLLMHAAKYPSAAINGLLLGSVVTSAPQAPSSPPSSPRGAPRRQIRIVDAVPLFHSYLSLAMPLETALAQVCPSSPPCRLHVQLLQVHIPTAESKSGRNAIDRKMFTAIVSDPLVLVRCSSRQLACAEQVDAYATERKLQVVGVYHASERLTDAALSPVAARIAEKVQQRCCPHAGLFMVRIALAFCIIPACIGLWHPFLGCFSITPPEVSLQLRKMRHRCQCAAVHTSMTFVMHL